MLNVVVVGRGSVKVRKMMEDIDEHLAAIGVTGDTNVEISHVSELRSLQGLRSNPYKPHIIVRGTNKKEAEMVGRVLSDALIVSWVEVDLFSLAIL